MDHQKHLFELPEQVTYLNGAYMSPQLKAVTQAGIEAIHRKSRPYEIESTDFFIGRTLLKQRFASLINAPDPEDTAIIPSVSYGLANAAQNIELGPQDEIVLLKEQFPSNVYCWHERALQTGAIVKNVMPPETFSERAVTWNKAILEAITPKTKVVAIPHIHWADGTMYDLKAIRAKTKEYNAFLIIDGTQSIGALPFSVSEIQPDALVCGGYKWMLGPYALGMAYYAKSLQKGIPIEQNWMNRLGSDDFAGLVDYKDTYQPKAGRFSVGESSNFILLPMLTKAIEQLLEWGIENIQEYCQKISADSVSKLRTMGCFVEDDRHRAHHLFGVFPPAGTDLSKLNRLLKENNIFISFRGKVIRVSPSVYNTTYEIEKLVHCFEKVLS
ncbi:aminotransferase class V-fold PLP-dependent enzyme [Ascidiimonas aurantiaca]|uniref:aminotransferase class V-fold PLP-dependent enzyme n=1 Tax=Ascidiimonas aurantiaca TaxID=1685432 RepID=UPI0030EE4138